MSAADNVHDLAAHQRAADPVDSARELEILLDLPDAGVRIRGAEIFGSGSRAACEITLSNGEVMSFDALRDVANPPFLAAELVSCAGTTPRITKREALRCVALLRRVAQQRRGMTDNDAAVEWGSSFLQAAQVLDLDIDDQAQRWEAFGRLAQIDPPAAARENHTGVAASCLVLRHADGTRLVRTGWFFAHARSLDIGINQAGVAIRMLRVGWSRRGSTGRIKATDPTFSRSPLAWSFYMVPDRWEEAT